MQPESTDDFIRSVRPLFRKRAVYRLLSGLALLLMMIGYGSWLLLPGLILFITVSLTLTDAEIALEDKVWARFSAQLDSVTAESYHELYPEPLKGVVGSMGDSRSPSLITQGTYGAYPIRLLRQKVWYKPESKYGSYSRAYRILEITTGQDFYHVFIDSRKNNTKFSSTAMNILSLSLRGNATIDVEGDVNKYFRIYVPAGSTYQSLVTLTPEKLLAIRDFGTRFDIEFVGNKIYIITYDKLKSARDILIYQETVFNLISNIGVDVIRTRNNVDDNLPIKTPAVFTFW